MDIYRQETKRYRHGYACKISITYSVAVQIEMASHTSRLDADKGTGERTGAEAGGDTSEKLNERGRRRSSSHSPSLYDRRCGVK